MKITCLLFAFAFAIVQLSAQELYVGVDVPEPKLIHKVEIVYPPPDTVFAYPYVSPAVLDIMISEQGTVTEVKRRHFESRLMDAAEYAIMKWRFVPTVIGNKAVLVNATAVVTLPYGRTPQTIDLGLGFTGKVLRLAPGDAVNQACRIPVIMDHNGTLEELPRAKNATTSAWDKDGKPVDPCHDLDNNYWPIPESDVPFAAIESKLKEGKPFSQYILQNPHYYYVGTSTPWMKHAQPGLERLYYSTFIVTNGSKLVQFAGMDPLVQPPRFDMDLGRLSEHVDISEYRNGAVFFCTVFVDEHGTILGIESRTPWGQKDENADVLSKAHVITPGVRNGVPVSTAVVIAIPVQ